jgi:hypothetical protein
MLSILLVYKTSLQEESLKNLLSSLLMTCSSVGVALPLFLIATIAAFNESKL